MSLEGFEGGGKPPSSLPSLLLFEEQKRNKKNKKKKKENKTRTLGGGGGRNPNPKLVTSLREGSYYPLLPPSRTLPPLPTHTPPPQGFWVLFLGTALGCHLSDCWRFCCISGARLFCGACAALCCLAALRIIRCTVIMDGYTPVLYTRVRTTTTRAQLSESSPHQWVD